MKISASIQSKQHEHITKVQTNDSSTELPIAPKPNGYGSSVNGGELLMLALATCFCNDLYREANKRNMIIKSVDVVASGEFGKEGEPGSNFKYQAKVIADATEKEIKDLILHTDQVAEIHNTLRNGIAVTLTNELV